MTADYVLLGLQVTINSLQLSRKLQDTKTNKKSSILIDGALCSQLDRLQSKSGRGQIFCSGHNMTTMIYYTITSYYDYTTQQ